MSPPTAPTDEAEDQALLRTLLDLLPTLPTPSRPPAAAPHLSVVLNPAAGAPHTAARLWSIAAALLAPRGVPVSEVRRTGKEGDGARVGRELRRVWGEREGEGREVLVLVGGDGTVHEVLNGLLLDAGEEDGGDGLWTGAGTVEVVLIPAGTANALYHHLFPPESPSYPADSPAAPFYSLLSFLRSLSAADSTESSPSPSARPASSLLPLPLALNTLPSPASQQLTTVVSSTALHAALLHDAEALRASHPGLERFKLAAQQNVTRWWSGTLRLAGHVQRYDPISRTWVSAGPVTALEGPFAYLVAALVSRFEPTFVVAPFRSPLHALAPSISSGHASIDIIAIRPLRHAGTAALECAGRSAEAREGFVQRVWGVTAGMYDGGRHVDEVYSGEEAEGAGEGSAVCEVWRAEQVEWVPEATEDLKSRLVCLDGALHDLGTAGGTLRVRAVGGAASGVRVWA